MTKRLSICITGAESSGKTTLCHQIALLHKLEVVPEFSRTYLSEINRPYVKNDLIIIARNQLNLLKDSIAKHPLVIADTGVEVVKIWHEEKYGSSVEINKLLEEQNHLIDHYILCSPDIPWEEDPLRENPHDRDRLHHLYQSLLSSFTIPYTEIKGSKNQRIDQINSILFSS